MTRLSSLKGSLARAFGAAAGAYHGAADVQQKVALRLAERICRLQLPPQPRVLEIGCGTGFLHQALAPNLGHARWLLTDLSEPMVQCARSRCGDQGILFAAMDGEHPALLPARFDLVCASLVFQWFEDLPRSLTRLGDLLAPGGALAFSMLGAESFPEWREAYRQIGAPSALRRLPHVADISQMIPPALKTNMESEYVTRSYPNAHAFLDHWRDIGTHMPDAGRAPLDPGTMRKILRRFETGITLTYQVVYVTAVRT